MSATLIIMIIEKEKLNSESRIIVIHLDIGNYTEEDIKNGAKGLAGLTL
jgi:hypothetical protein